MPIMIFSPVYFFSGHTLSTSRAKSKNIFGIKKTNQDEKTKSTEGTKCDSCSYGSNVTWACLDFQ